MKNLKHFSTKQLLQKIESFKKIFNRDDQATLAKAINLALELHSHQPARPDGPYFNHLLRVAAFLFECGCKNINIITAALLHDSIEDQSNKILKKYTLLFPDSQNGTSKERAGAYLSLEFGTVVGTYVFYLTNPDWSDIPSKEERNKLYFLHVKEIIENKPDIAIIKLADFCDNSLDLQLVDNYQMRLRYCKKYLPIFPLFINALTSGIIEVASYKIELLNALKQAEKYVREAIVSPTKKKLVKY